MFGSPAVSTAFTALFVATGAWSVVRLAHEVTGRGPRADRVAELSHLVMGVAMIAMAWGVVTGPTGAGGIVALGALGATALWVATRLVRGTGRSRSAVGGYHLLMAAAMLWMIAAMPQIMSGATVTAAGHGPTGHHGMSGMSGMDGMDGMDAPAAVAPAAPAWVTAVTWSLVLALLVAALLWALCALRPGACDVEEHGTLTGSDGDGGGVAVAAPVTVAVPTRVRRLDGWCHTLTSLGMAAMIIAML